MPRDTFIPAATPMKPAQRKTSPLALMACGMTLLGATLLPTSALAATDSSAANTDAATTDTNSAKAVSQFAARRTSNLPAACNSSRSILKRSALPRVT